MVTSLETDWAAEKCAVCPGIPDNRRRDGNQFLGGDPFRREVVLAAKPLVTHLAHTPR
jgi:hypothetical protein